MTKRPEAMDDRDGVLRLSHRLVALHVGGIALLILVVLLSVIWISAEHNKLAKTSSQDLVRAGIDSMRARAFTLVRDYSIWDEGYAAALANDRGWLYSNIGVGVTEIDTFDLVVLDVPGHGAPFGWLKDSPDRGETGLLPAAILDPVIALLDTPGPGNTGTRTLLAEFRGEPWIFTISRVRPVAGVPEGVSPDSLPRQIHGHRVTQEKITQIGESILADGITLTMNPGRDQASVPLVDFTGKTIGCVAWSPPRPGASILRQVALPLGLALAVITIISGISSLYAVRSARRLESALHDAKAADRSKSEFLSNVSHELRTPMNGILGVAQLLRTTELDAEQQELVSVLFVSANAQMALISDLLDLSRMESGNRHLVEEPFEPAPVLRDVSEMMRVAAAKKGIAFEADWDGIAGLTLLGDGRAVRQIVTNLLGNAVKFTERGRVGIRARAAEQDDRVQLAITVTDTGRGIPAEALPHIFERFYQVDGSLTRSTEGTGLGLAISHKLAAMMGGRVTVTSELGAGSTFEFISGFEVVSRARGALDAA
jgi:signal transduction histidine kinase